MKLTSSAFEEGREIPAQHTCAGNDVSPPLAWKNVPPETVSFVLICEHPCTPEEPWIHWLVYNIPADQQAFEAGEALSLEQLGTNGWGHQAYGGPCPPHHPKEHVSKERYYFKLYALDALLSLDYLGRPPLKKEVDEAMKGHVLTEASLFGHYHRPHQGFEWPHRSKNLPPR